MSRISLLLPLLVGSAFSQTITATLAGTVKDPQGAAVPNASVTVTSAESSFRRTVSSNAVGHYTVPFLQPGTYNILATAAGFGKFVRNEILLEVAQVAEIDLMLPLGTTNETIEVRDDAPALITEASNVEMTVENKLITELPSGERSTLAFLNLVPGAIDAGFALAQGEI
jgi:hypothetical protein